MPKRLLQLLVPLMLVGCATQPYPDLPDDGAADTGASPSRQVSRELRESDQDDAAAAANVSDVARWEAGLPPVSQKVSPLPPDPQQLPAADKRELKILLGDRRFEYFEDAQLVWSGKVSAGTAEHPTPRGEFRVTAKDINKRSGSYTNYFNWPTPMPYALQFRGPYWVHEGYVPNENASHGCVRLRHEDAKFVYDRMKIGDAVSIVE